MTRLSPRGGSPSTGRSVATRRVGLWGNSLGPLLLSASVAPALSRLIVHGMSARVVVPFLVGIVIADVATALAVRWRVNVLLATGLGWAVSVCGLLVLVDPSLCNPASPHFLHVGLISTQLRAAFHALANDGTPLPSLNGVIIVLGAAAAAAAALTRRTWAWRASGRSVVLGRGALAPCLAPSLAIFVYSTLVSAEQGRVAASVSYFIGVLVFLALADRTDSPVTSVAGSSPPPTLRVARRLRLPTGALIGLVLAMLVVVAAGAGLSGMRLTVFQVTARPAVTHGDRSLSARGGGAPLSAAAKKKTGIAAPSVTSTSLSPPTTLPATTVTSPPAGSAGTHSGSRHHHATPHRQGSIIWVLVVVLLGLAAAAVAVAWAWRHRRASQEARLHPDQRVVRAWEHALGALRSRGLSRQAGETPGEYATRVGSVERTSVRSVEAAAVARLAGLVEMACYTPRPCTSDQVVAAQKLASTIVSTNRPHRLRRRTRGRHRARPEGQA